MRGYLFLIISFFFLVSSCTNKQKESLNASENAIPMDLRPSPEKKPKSPKKVEKVDEKLKGLKNINKDSLHFARCVNKISKEFGETRSTVENEFDKLRQ